MFGIVVKGFSCTIAWYQYLEMARTEKQLIFGMVEKENKEKLGLTGI